MRDKEEAETNTRGGVEGRSVLLGIPDLKVNRRVSHRDHSKAERKLKRRESLREEGNSAALLVFRMETTKQLWDSGKCWVQILPLALQCCLPVVDVLTTESK